MLPAVFENLIISTKLLVCILLNTYVIIEQSIFPSSLELNALTVITITLMSSVVDNIHSKYWLLLEYISFYRPKDCKIPKNPVSGCCLKTLLSQRKRKWKFLRILDFLRAPSYFPSLPDFRNYLWLKGFTTLSSLPNKDAFVSRLWVVGPHS